jgi:hypothetical protein
MEWMRNEIEWRDRLIDELRKDLHKVEHQRDKLITEYEEVTIPLLVEANSRIGKLTKQLNPEPSIVPCEHGLIVECKHGRPECECQENHG